ncbi:hypothetical protein PSACC_01830 [Paramicrosporidium saccamoebae]|uniref:Peptidase S33 tripeptidyl aminopeptidase-like C-terminal domain-containing protein n=1 Tax=Paramicrosporidium saccamoebae TaxID=1246581 RepID=A0A2H9TKS3_9FUNG|nr:hypothetical protein PSACC_01830 [Paramicrosporidium saccamoebae]
MVDWEHKLRDLNPTIRWESSCSDKFCASTDLSTKRGYVKVPSNYTTNGKTFDVGFQQVTVPGSKPWIHVLYLAGGPGGYGADEMDSANMWTEICDGDVAGYAVDHRGLGTSGEFASASYRWSDMKGNLQKHLSSGPFDAQDVTLENAALDVGMISLAIKMGPGWTERSRIVLHGFSYGSEWAHHSASRLPNLYNSVIMGGISTVHKNRNTSLQGIAENCAMDAFCRSKMGGAVEKNYRQAVRNMIDPSYNECTELFHNVFDITGTGQGEKVRELSFILMDLIMGNHERFPNSREYRSVMAILPIVKATSDCTDLDEYRRKVIEPLEKYINPVYKKTSWAGGDDSNTLVNTLVLLSYDYCFESVAPPSVSSSYDDLYPSEAYKQLYHWRYEALQQAQKNLTCTLGSPVVSSTTEFAFAQSRMDLNTPYYPGWELYNEIKVPRKHWLLFQNRGHDGYMGECMAALVLQMLYPAGHTFDYKTCMAAEDAERKLDWTLKNAPDFQDIWDVVATESNTTPVFKAVPTHHSEGSAPQQRTTTNGGSHEPTTTAPGQLPTTLLIGLGIGGVVLVLATIAILVYIKRRKSSPDEAMPPA